MTGGHLFSRHIGILETALALLVAVGLAIPFVPIPGEHPTWIAVRFWSADMPRTGSFIAQTSSNICRILSALVSYRNSETGEFVQIDCGERADALTRQIHADRPAATIAAAARQP